MIYRPYGKTGKRISILSAGGMRYSAPQKIDEMAAIPLAAAQAGVNYFDTAPGYSEDKSETILGVAMREMKRQGLEHYVATKTWAHDRETFWKHLEASLKTLGVEKIDFYHAWGVNDKASYETRKSAGVIRAMREAQEQGLVGHAVCSSHMSGPDIAEMVRERLFEGILLGFSAVNFVFRTEGIRAAAEMGMGVVTMNPLYGGMITEHPDRFSFLKTRADESMLEAALHFILGWDGVTSALVGFRSVEDVRSAVEAVRTFRPVSVEERDRITGHIEANFNDLCTTCDYCRDCPQGVPVAKYMEAFNHTMLYGNEQALFDRLKWHWGLNDIAKLEDCVECRICEEKCNQKLPILERFAKMKKFVRKEEA